MTENYYAVLMAGGVGSRFWPVSTTDNPKQFHDMLGTGETLIQRTFSRLNKLIPKENIFILTNERYTDLVLEQLPEVQSDQIVAEPAMRNTAPCILYAALKIKKINPNACMVVAPSDHWIENESAFIVNLKQSLKTCAENDVLMTLGIQPAFPNTGYGYIKYEKALSLVKKVDSFTEKPNYETAKSFLKQGNYLWNAGIFIWSVQSIVQAFEKYKPELTTLFKKGESLYNTPEEKQFIIDNYPLAENISIDYAILEQAQNVYVLPAEFDWNDLGTWGSLYDKLEKEERENVTINAKVLAKSAKGNIIHTSTDKVVVIDGLQDYIIVDKADVLLIYPKNKEQKIKEVLKKVKSTYGEQYG